MGTPTNMTELRAFIGAVTYCCNMWPGRSHILSPVDKTHWKGKISVDSTHQKAFDEMKAVMVFDAIIIYPNHNLLFQLYTDTSDYQMGPGVMQNGKVVTYWSRKLTKSQHNYTTMEKNILSIVMCFKEFWSMLLETQITVFTDHNNSTFCTLNVQHVLHWCLFLEEFGPEFKYFPGKDNILADCVSCLPLMSKLSEGETTRKGEDNGQSRDNGIIFESPAIRSNGESDHNEKHTAASIC
eukprot:15342615-Ditylum_brightwellii.AAC.1